MYLIERIVCVSEGVRTAYDIELQTDDIEKTRSELIRMYQCERINFVYSQLKDGVE